MLEEALTFNQDGTTVFDRLISGEKGASDRRNSGAGRKYLVCDLDQNIFQGIF